MNQSTIWEQFRSCFLWATNNDLKRLEKKIMALSDDLKNGVARLIAGNEKILAALKAAAAGDGLTAVEAQALVDQMNAESDKDDAAVPPANT